MPGILLLWFGSFFYANDKPQGRGASPRPSGGTCWALLIIVYVIIRFNEFVDQKYL